MEEQEIIGEYTVIDYIDDGKDSDVLLVKDIQGNVYAMKILKGRRGTEVQRKRYSREARILGQLDHPGIIPIHDNGVFRTSPYIVLKYISGGNLRVKYSEAAEPTEKEIRSYVQQISAALEHAHKLKIVHSDLKPENILIDENGQLFLTDFDAAQEMETSPFQRQSTQTSRGHTLGYAAPEQRLPGDLAWVSPKSDQYTLGVIVYEWICGENPFQQNKKQLSKRNKRMKATDAYKIPSFKSKGIPDIPPQVERVVRKALAKDDAKRYPNIGAFAQAFERAYALQLIPFSSRFFSWVDRNGFRYGFAFQIVGLIIGVIPMMTFPLIQPNLSALPGFILVSMGLTLLCVKVARGSYKHDFVQLIVTIVLGGAVAGMLYFACEKFIGRMNEFVVAEPPLVAPLLMIVLWVAAAAIFPPILAVSSFMSSLVVPVVWRKG